MEDDKTPAEQWAAASDRTEIGAPPDAPEELTEEQRAEMAEALARMQGMMAPQAWRPACCNCLNNHKLAIMEITARLKLRGIEPPMPEYVEAMQAALQAGAMLAQNPLGVIGHNGAKPDVIPPVREADVLVNGNSVCMVCFPAQKQTSLLTAGGGFR